MATKQINDGVIMGNNDSEYFDFLFLLVIGIGLVICSLFCCALMLCMRWHCKYINPPSIIKSITVSASKKSKSDLSLKPASQTPLDLQSIGVNHKNLPKNEKKIEIDITPEINNEPKIDNLTDKQQQYLLKIWMEEQKKQYLMESKRFKKKIDELNPLSNETLLPNSFNSDNVVTADSSLATSTMTMSIDCIADPWFNAQYRKIINENNSSITCDTESDSLISNDTQTTLTMSTDSLHENKLGSKNNEKLSSTVKVESRKTSGSITCPSKSSTQTTFSSTILPTRFGCDESRQI